MTEPPSTREMLRELSTTEMRHEIERRQCAFDGHQPHNFIMDASGVPVSALCGCGEAHYNIERVR